MKKKPRPPRAVACPTCGTRSFTAGTDRRCEECWAAAADGWCWHGWRSNAFRGSAGGNRVVNRLTRRG